MESGRHYGAAIVSNLAGRRHPVTDMHNPGQAASVRRSRRNLFRIGAIATSAMLPLMKTKQAHAGGNSQGGNSQGGNSQGAGHCFLRGTMIRTADGNKKIEDL